MHPVKRRFTHRKHGKILMIGIVAEIAVGKDRTGSGNFGGERIKEQVKETNNCAKTKTQAIKGGTFVVGTGTSFGKKKFPTIKNTFYDHHQLGMQDTPAALNRWRARKCTVVREQTYLCGGTPISKHEITTTIKPVKSGDPTLTTVKKDVNSCLTCSSSP